MIPQIHSKNIESQDENCGSWTRLRNIVLKDYISIILNLYWLI